MDIIGIQKILNDAVKEYDLTANVPPEVLVSLISVDIYRKLNSKIVTQKPAPRNRQNALGQGVEV